MKVLEHGGRIGRTLLFFPCTAEPVWVFEQTIALLAQRWHVFQVVFDGHEPEEPGDFTSVEQTVDEVTEYLKAHGIARLDAAYGCSLGGACLTRFLALGEIPVGRAIIDGGITPYQLPYLLRKLILARDVLSFKLAANDRKVLEAAFPPERFTIPGHDPVKEYDAIEAYLKTYSDRLGVQNLIQFGLRICMCRCGCFRWLRDALRLLCQLAEQMCDLLFDLRCRRFGADTFECFLRGCPLWQSLLGLPLLGGCFK